MSPLSPLVQSTYKSSLRRIPSTTHTSDPLLHNMPHANGASEATEIPTTRTISSHAILYLRDSPAGLLFCWIIGTIFERRSSNIGSPRLHHDRLESVRHDLNKNEGCAPETLACKIHVANKESAQEAQSWPLPKRVLVAGIICLYT